MAPPLIKSKDKSSYHFLKGPTWTGSSLAFDFIGFYSTPHPLIDNQTVVLLFLDSSMLRLRALALVFPLPGILSLQTHFCSLPHFSQVLVPIISFQVDLSWPLFLIFHPSLPLTPNTLNSLTLFFFFLFIPQHLPSSIIPYNACYLSFFNVFAFTYDVYWLLSIFLS